MRLRRPLCLTPLLLAAACIAPSSEEDPVAAESQAWNVGDYDQGSAGFKGHDLILETALRLLRERGYARDWINDPRLVVWIHFGEAFADSPQYGKPRDAAHPDRKATAATLGPLHRPYKLRVCDGTPSVSSGSNFLPGSVFHQYSTARCDPPYKEVGVTRDATGFYTATYWMPITSGVVMNPAPVAGPVYADQRFDSKPFDYAFPVGQYTDLPTVAGIAVSDVNATLGMHGVVGVGAAYDSPPWLGVPYDCQQMFPWPPTCFSQPETLAGAPSSVPNPVVRVGVDVAIGVTISGHLTEGVALVKTVAAEAYDLLTGQFSKLSDAPDTSVSVSFDITSVPFAFEAESMYHFANFDRATLAKQPLVLSLIPEAMADRADVLTHVPKPHIFEPGNVSAMSHGAILYQLGRKFWPANNWVSSQLSELPLAGVGVLNGHPGSAAWSIDSHVTTVDLPHTYLGGQPFMCASPSGNCNAGGATWPVWVPEDDYNFKSEESGLSNASLVRSELMAPSPPKNMRPAMIYLGWAVHKAQDIALKVHAFNQTGTDHRTIENALDGPTASITDTFVPTVDALFGAPTSSPRANADLCRKLAISPLWLTTGGLASSEVASIFNQARPSSYGDGKEDIWDDYNRAVFATMQLLACFSAEGGAHEDPPPPESGPINQGDPTPPHCASTQIYCVTKKMCIPKTSRCLNTTGAGGGGLPGLP